MAFLPIPSVTQTTQLISIAKSVVAVASATFADLMDVGTNFSSTAKDGRESKSFPARTGSELFPPANSRLSLRIQNEALLEDFQSAFVEELAEWGIDISDGIELEFSESGSIEVVGEHPDKEAIEMLLSGNERFSEAIQQIAINALLTDASTSSAKTPREFRLNIDGTRAHAQFV